MKKKFCSSADVLATCTIVPLYIAFLINPCNNISDFINCTMYPILSIICIFWMYIDSDSCYNTISDVLVTCAFSCCIIGGLLSFIRGAFLILKNKHNPNIWIDVCVILIIILLFALLSIGSYLKYRNRLKEEKDEK